MDSLGIPTPEWRVLTYTPDEVEELAQETPLGRIGQPEDVARAVAYLAGEGASFITGQILGVNGGFVI